MGVKVHDGIKVVSPNGLITKTINTSDDGYLTIPSPQFSDAINLTGGQIKFPATQVPSADANTLDDYEEGGWTPILATDGTNPTGVSYSSRVGKYTKNGNVVTAYGSISFTTYTGGTGNIGIGNLPFIGDSAIGVVLSEYITFPASKTQIDIIMIPGTSFALLEFLQSGGTYNPHALTSAAPSNATVKRIIFSFSYFTT